MKEDEFHTWQEKIDVDKAIDINHRGGKRQIGYQDAVPNSRSSSPTTFLKNCGRGVSPGINTCHKIVDLVNNGMLIVKYLRSNESPFYVS